MRPAPFHVRRRLRVTSAVLAAAGFSIVAAVGGAVGATAPPQSTEPAATEPAGTAAPSDEVVTDYLAFTGGTEGPADESMDPVVIGWVNAEGGVGEQPAATRAAEAAIAYVNAELGGIGGRPLALDTCFIVEAEEEGQACAQQMVNNDAVSVIVFGAVVTGNQSFHATVAGSKPVIIGVAANPADNVAENAYALFGTQDSVLTPWGTYARDVLGAETAAVVFPSQAGASTAADQATAGLEAAGLVVSSVGYEQDQTDLLGPLTAAGGQDADVIVPMTDFAGCTNLYLALDQIGATQPVVSNPLCLAADWSDLGGVPQWTFGIAQSLPSDPTAPDSAYYVETSASQGLEPADAFNPFAALAWANILHVARFMNAVGADNITPESIAEQVQNFEGPLIMGAPSVDCGQNPEQPAQCNNQTKFYHHLGEFQFEVASDWLQPPE